MQDNVAEGLAAAASHPVTVQVFNQGPGIWGNVATGLITAAAAIVAVMLTHRFTLQREMQTSEAKLDKERLFIATELVFLLERFAQGCLPAAIDPGNQDENTQARYIPNYQIPELSYLSVAGDWRSLPAELLYQVQQLKVLREESVSMIASAFIESTPYDDDGIIELNNQASRLGIRAIHLSRELRKVSSMPTDRLEVRIWSVWPQLCIAAGKNLERSLRSKQRFVKTHAELARLSPGLPNNGKTP